MKLGSYTLIRNEIQFIEPHLQAWLPYLDNMVFYDGNSTDGTLEVLKKYAKDWPNLTVVEDKNPQNLKNDYVYLFNECMRSCKSDVAMFLHPDMFPENANVVKHIPDDIIAATVNVRSFAGNPEGDIYEIHGRGRLWKNIYRLKNPDLGAHYHGFYGAQNEDTYFSEITGSKHNFYGQDIDRYEYPVFKSDLNIYHYSDVRSYTRRLNRMEKCLMNQGLSYDEAVKLAPTHPRVSLKNGDGFTFVKVKKPSFMEVLNVG